MRGKQQKRISKEFHINKNPSNIQRHFFPLFQLSLILFGKLERENVGGGKKMNFSNKTRMFELKLPSTSL
jgi:hypothetical protein